MIDILTLSRGTTNSPKKKIAEEMKREREAVWNDDEDQVINERPISAKVYGKKAAAGKRTANLRAEFQYVPQYQSICISLV